MIIHFVYTECRSPGPFKKESGFKVKSAVVPELFSTDSESSVTSRKDLVERAVANLASYSPPDISPLVPRAEFDAHAKSWIYTELAQNADLDGDTDKPQLRSFLFARMFTSGYAGGRARNPFHEGYIFEAKDWRAFSDLCNTFTYPLKARPADLVESVGWQSPRGDVELEANELRSSDLFEIHSFEERLDSRVRPAIFGDVESSHWTLSRYCDSLKDSAGFGLEVANESDFYDWVSLLSHLVPARAAWQMSFSDIWRKPRQESNVGSSWHFFRGPSDHEVPSEEAQEWAKLVMSSFELGIEMELLTLLDSLGDKFYVGRNQISAGLTLVPLAYLLLDEALFPDDREQEDWGALDLLQTMTPPAQWEKPQFKQELLDRVADPSNTRLSQIQKQELASWLASVPA